MRPDKRRGPVVGATGPLSKWLTHSQKPVRCLRYRTDTSRQAQNSQNYRGPVCRKLRLIPNVPAIQARGGSLPREQEGRDSQGEPVFRVACEVRHGRRSVRSLAPSRRGDGRNRSTSLISHLRRHAAPSRVLQVGHRARRSNSTGHGVFTLSALGLQDVDSEANRGCV